MTSIFGGAQTVPQTQFTNQNYSQTQNTAQNQTQAQTYSANPFAQQQGQWVMDWMNALRSYGNQFSQPIPGLQIAALTPEQQTGIGALTNAGYGAGNALVPAGQQALTSAGQAITPGDINAFYNPMASNITANLQDIFNQQNLQDRIGSTAKTGGVGAERAAVSQALLGKQQGLAAGQTYAGLYQQALQAAQQQKAQQLQAGQATLQGGFGAYGQGMQAASIPQAQQQAVNQALYQQQLGAYQDPFLRLQTMLGGLPVIAGLGGTGASIGSGTTQGGVTGAQTGLGNASTTYPAPSALSQIAGLGSLALGVGSLFAGSDKRMKTDIQKMGEDKETGLPMYAYRYKGDPKHYPKVVGPMAQDVKKKYPSAVKELARGGGIPHFQYGGGEDDSGGQQQQQDTNYFDDFTDVGIGQQGGDAPQAPYQKEGATWDPKRIFSPDRLARAQRAIALAQKATQQSQIARPRVSSITFPQVPWKSGITFARGGRLAIDLPMLNRAIAGQQEGGRVDAATADSWGGHKVWRPGFPKLNPNPERQMERGSPFSLGRPTPEDILRLRNMRPEGRYQDGGEVDEPDTMPDGGPEDPEDTEDNSMLAPGMPLPLPRPPGAGPGAPMTDLGGGGGGGLPQVGAGGQSLFGRPVSPGAMALIQAGLGMLAASGQRDARGLPMSGLGAIGAGGMAGINTYQKSMEDQRKEALARQGMALRERTLNEQMALRREAAANLEKYRTGLLAARTGEDKPITIEGELGKESVVKQPDGTYKRVKVLPAEGEDEETATAFPTNPAEKYDASLASSDAPQTDEQKQVAAFAAASEVKFQTPVAAPVKRLIKHFGISEDEFDFNALRIALGDTSTLTGLTARGGRAGQMLRQAYISRAARYYIEQGLSPHDANAAVAEFAGMKAGARSLANQEAKITGALQSAKAVASLVTDLSDKIPRTQIKSINTLLMTGKEQIGDETVVRYKTALETLVADYAQALGRGNTVLTDNARQHARELLEKGYSQGQVKATVDQMLVEIERTQHATQRGMDVYLRRRPGGAGSETTPPPASGAPMTAGPLRKQFKQGWGVWDGTQWVPERP